MKTLANIVGTVLIALAIGACTTAAPGEKVIRDSNILRLSDRTIVGDNGRTYRSAAVVFKRLGSVTVIVDDPQVKTISAAKGSQADYLKIANAEGKRLCAGVRKRARTASLLDRAEFRKSRGHVALIKRVYC